MREHVKVVGVVTVGSINSRVLLERVSDGMKVTCLFKNTELPAKDSTISVEWDNCRTAVEREIRIVGLHNSGKRPAARKRKVAGAPLEAPDPLAGIISDGTGVPVEGMSPPEDNREVVTPETVSADVADPLAGGVEVSPPPGMVPSGPVPPAGGYEESFDPGQPVPGSVGAVAPGLADELL